MKVIVSHQRFKRSCFVVLKNIFVEIKGTHYCKYNILQDSSINIICTYSTCDKTSTGHTNSILLTMVLKPTSGLDLNFISFLFYSFIIQFFYSTKTHQY